MSKLAALIHPWIPRHSGILALGILEAVCRTHYGFLEAVCVKDALRILIRTAEIEALAKGREQLFHPQRGGRDRKPLPIIGYRLKAR